MNIERFNAYKEMADAARSRFNRKCDFEWKFSFGLWAGLAALIGIAGKTGFKLVSLNLGIKILILVVILIIHISWLFWIQRSLKYFSYEEIFWRNLIKKELGKGPEMDSIDSPRRYVSPLIQTAITFILSFILLFLFTTDISSNGSRSPYRFIRDSHESLNGILWMQTSAEYQQLCQLAYSLAANRLDEALNAEDWTAALEQTAEKKNKPTAIIVDVDETVLDNSKCYAQLIKERRSFSEHLWKEWVARKSATPVPGALDFLKLAASEGVTVFYVTNRDRSLEPETRENLEKLGFPISANSTIDTILCLNEQPAWGSDKSTRRRHVAQTHRILFLVGDDLGDFVSGAKESSSRRNSLAQKYSAYWGEKWILLPNPDYGSWERACYGNQSGLSEVETLRRKYDSLSSFK
jgi:acid phosphatase